MALRSGIASLLAYPFVLLQLTLVAAAVVNSAVGRVVARTAVPVVVVAAPTADTVTTVDGFVPNQHVSIRITVIVGTVNCFSFFSRQIGE